MKQGDQFVRLFGEYHGHDQNSESVEVLRHKRIYSILKYLDKELDDDIIVTWYFMYIFWIFLIWFSNWWNKLAHTNKTAASMELDLSNIFK